MPDPTDQRAVADDPSGIVQQMPEGTTEALKPCPFCGEAAKNFSQSQFWLGCSNPECGAELVIRRDKDEAYSAWNRRATDADLRAEVERLRQALTFYRDCWSFKTNKRYGGLEWRPKVELLDDCGNTARAALSPETEGGQDD